MVVGEMPAYSNPDRCDGCRERQEVACREICPSDILHLDEVTGKAVNIEPDQCWECYACVKACPRSAMQIRGYSEGILLGARLTPQRGRKHIDWEVESRGGELRRFCFPIRTTAWGTIEPFRGLSPPSLADLRTQDLCGELRQSRAAAV